MQSTKVLQSSKTELSVRVPYEYYSATGSSIISVITAGTTLTTTSDFVLDGPEIHSFSPQNGSRGTLVTVQGNNFNLVKELNQVFIGDLEAEITAASETSITFKVPAWVRSQ